MPATAEILPEAPLSRADVLDALDQMDPIAPRTPEVTQALIDVLLTQGADAPAAALFAQQSLRAEITAQLGTDIARVTLPVPTLSLLAALMHDNRIVCMLLEEVLTSYRTTLLAQAQSGAKPSEPHVKLAEAMARHSFYNEYIWPETKAEADSVATLVTRISAQIETGQAVSAFDLFMAGAYRSLHTLEAVRNWVQNLARRDAGALDPTLCLLVLDPLVESATQIEAITPVTAPTSQKVQSQYEENPYPRWRYIPQVTRFDDIATYVAATTGQQPPKERTAAQRAKVLIAGAGTGVHPISAAQTLPNAAVLAIDLSRASLAYATREASARSVTNVAFAQADILKLAEVDVEFDLIESVGVLHHMADPEAGLQALLKVLKPGGFIRLALYSKHARHAVNAARDVFAMGDYPGGLAGIRAVRRDLMHSDDPAITPLRGIRDVFSASEFRDLVMHVQEHQFTLPQISSMLNRNGLKFLGFASPSALTALRAMPPKMAERRLRDLKAWDTYERRNPDMFLRMYDFFCMKR